MDPMEIKNRSEQIMQLYSCPINNTVSPLKFVKVRPAREIIERTAVMNAMLQIYFGTKIDYVRKWVDIQKLAHRLSPFEAMILQKKNKELTEEENTNIYWYIESIWAFFWVGGYITDLSVDKPVQECITKLIPNIKRGDDYSVLNNMFPQPDEEIYQMADLYYRLHWAVEETDPKKIPVFFNRDVIMERRKALAWTINPDYHWDTVPMEFEYSYTGKMPFNIAATEETEAVNIEPEIEQAPNLYPTNNLGITV
jgi:hypothetical protein